MALPVSQPRSVDKAHEAKKRPPAPARLSLIVGGARSGKSHLAEKLALQAGREVFYIATAQAFDDEMRARIALHQQARQGYCWRTREAPLDLPAALKTATEQDIVLLDCATLWLSNLLLSGLDPVSHIEALREALASCAAPVIVVSNEVGWGIVPENALARRFRDEQGKLNQQLASQADLVVGVMAGLPMVLKGTLPKALL